MIGPAQREASEGQSKNESEAAQRVAEYQSAATMAEATFRADAHVQVRGQGEACGPSRRIGAGGPA